MMVMLQVDPDKYQMTNSFKSSQLTPLVVQAIEGKDKAFERLFDMFQKDVFRMIYYRTRSKQDAEDLTQEIFIRAYKKISGLKEAGRFRTWLFSIAVNRVRDFYRKQRIENLFSLSTTEDDTLAGPSTHNLDIPAPLENLLRLDFWKQVEKFLSHLSKMEKEVFLLRFFDQLTLTEISQVLTKSESTVKTHLYRALVKFKKASSIRQHLQEGGP
jgi:RNA polymerase sigma-70 factor (ECF subfamily)